MGAKTPIGDAPNVVAASQFHYDDINGCTNSSALAMG